MSYERKCESVLQNKNHSIVPVSLLLPRSRKLIPVRYPMADGNVPINVIWKDMGVSSSNMIEIMVPVNLFIL